MVLQKQTRRLKHFLTLVLGPWFIVAFKSLHIPVRNLDFCIGERKATIMSHLEKESSFNWFYVI